LPQASDSYTGVKSLASHVRASDRDREFAARRLTDAASTGVLGITELGSRLERVLSAATRGELEAELSDLPVPRPVRRSWVRECLRAHLAVFAIVNCGLIAIWAAAGFGDFWPVWPMIGWGMLIAGHTYGASVASPRTELDANR
jgi:hypothetical protein